MSWFPVGPDFVFAPRNGNFKRLSRRNEVGRQGLVSQVAIDPTDPATIYVVERPSSGGTSAFRTQTDGESWIPIADSLQQADPTIDPSAIAVNPAHPEIIYMGTWTNLGVYVSNTRGDSWGPRNAIPGSVRKIVVDPRTASNPATTVLYAATTTGVYRSPDGGGTWALVLAGDVWSVAAYIPTTGTAHFYAGVWQTGVFHATDPTAPANWANLNTQGIGLPAHTAASTTEPNGNFDAILVDYCPRNPDRVYAWMTKVSCDATGANCNEVTAALFTTSSPLTLWTSVPMTSPPGPGYGFYAFGFAVAPNSPGNGVNDILFFASVGLFRSIDGGQTWQGDAIGFHADQHAFAFFPASLPAGVIPAFYVGNDGGIGVSTRFCDPAFSIAISPTDFNEGLSYTNSGVYQNYNRGKQSSAVYQYNSHPAISALGYIGCQDTGIAAGTGALGWRGIADADGGAIAAAPASNGVAVWSILGAYCDWPGFRILTWTDKGEFSPAVTNATLGAGGSLLAGTSAYVVGLDNKCLAGVASRNSTTLSAAIMTTGSQAATPTSMSGIAMGSVLAVGGDPCFDPNFETVTVTAVTATTFTANFTKAHPAGDRVRIELDHNFVARIDASGIAAQISQDFGPSNTVFVVAASPLNADILYCATSDQKLFQTNSGSTASSATVWTEIAGGKPAALSMSSIALDSAGNVYVLLRSSVTTGGAAGITSPLFKIVGGNWIHQPCSGAPAANVLGFGKLLADPVQPDTLYASHDARVFQLKLSRGTWNWTDISDGLPGQWIYDLWIGNIGSAASPKVILRTAIPTRAVWEQDVSGGASDPLVALYLRDNLLDQGWLGRSPDGLPNPYDPANPGATVFHYQCADIKIDARQPGSGLVSPFFQTDPEGTIPPTHVLFDELRDNSENLPQSDTAWVQVRVHNRSHTLVNNVRVWAIYCNASAGVPGLNVSPSLGNTFDFWSQFTVTGQIFPNLPADSPWKSIGAAQILSGIDAANPKVASWSWTIPTLPSGDPGHYCMVAFLHSAISPINEASLNVDEMTPRNKQVGQKNLHIGPPLPPSPPPGGGPGGPGGQPGAHRMQEYVEFHNPTESPREATLVLDLRSLPTQLVVSFQLTRLETVQPLGQSVGGVARTRRPGVREHVSAGISSFFRWLGWLIQWVGCWIENVGRWIVGLPLRSCKRKPQEKLPDFEPTIYEAAPSGRVEVRGVRLPPFGSCAVLFSVRNAGTLEAGSEYAFQVQQLVKGLVVGGSTFVVRIAGNKRLRPPYLPDSRRTDLSLRMLERIEREAESLQYVPPWAKDVVEARKKELGKEL